MLSFFEYRFISDDLGSWMERSYRFGLSLYWVAVLLKLAKIMLSLYD
ncbi:hypothetical protein [Metabacillus fastidiosus]|nr:hypothetical protein [Metabacillus fastidiosus]MEC2076494.1 hypothetical protein [Metabacillus fastidiosus]